MRTAIEDIKVGTRKRKDMGDLDALAASIKTVGLLHPIVLTPKRDLVCGGRRLEACKLLGWEHVETTTAHTLDDVAKAELAEIQENTCRKDLLPSEMVAKARAIEPIEREAAKARQKDHGDTAPGKTKNTSEKVTEVKGESRNKVAAAVGVSAPTLAKAKAVVDAAEAHPKHYGDLVEQMDKGGKVAPVHAEMVRRHVEDKAPPPPKGPTPAEMAKADVERRWREATHKVYVLMNSIRDQGGIRKLAAKWSAPGVKQEAAELRRIAKQFTEMADELESENV